MVACDYSSHTYQPEFFEREAKRREERRDGLFTSFWCVPNRIPLASMQMKAMKVKIMGKSILQTPVRQ